MKNIRKIACIAAGALCIAYYFILWWASRPGLSFSLIWPLLGTVFIAAGILSEKAPKWLRVAWRAALCIGLIALVALEVPVVSGMRSDAPDGLRYLIVLGARVDPDGPSPALNRRLNAVMACIDRHPDAIIIVSGGQGRDEPMSEAQCIRDELVRRGVDESRIVMEDRSTSTSENIAFSMALMDDPAAPTGIVTNNYHVWRAVHIAKKAGLQNAHGIAAKYTGFTLFHYLVREAICIVVDGLRGNL